MKHSTQLFAAPLLALALFTASNSPLHAETAYYLVDSIASESGDPPTRAQASELARIYADLARASGVQATLVYSTDPDINAFATEDGDEKLIVVQEGLLAKLDHDRDAVAATLGHELAHHKADHIRAGRRKQENVRVLGSILGAIVGAKVGNNSGDLAGAAAGAAVGVGAGLLALKFNRNQELEADRLSIGWMIEAGYNPQGMLRLQENLGAMAGKQRAGILSTHPTSKKRYQAAEKLIAKLAPPDELLSRAQAPLVGDESLAQARAAIEGAKAERVADALAAPGEVPSAAALAPIAGIAFDDYAALGNELLYAGKQGQAKVLKRHNLDEARLVQLNDGFRARMQETPALAQRYSVGFFRATQGKLALHGRDLADSYEKGQPLALQPPYPLEKARELRLAMEARGMPGFDDATRAKAEREILAPHGLTYYDFLIGHNWWSRRITVAALSGDPSLMQAYFAAPDDAREQAAAAGVKVGNNVKIGSNVRVGGKELPASPASDEPAPRQP